ncbi:MAG: hypothetical protein JNK60_22225 [Acidobacteria bacterium]|nr:hypothetical protein [Acidobacteriota bacterium]
MSPRARAFGITTLFGLLAVLVWPVYPHFQSSNELTRWAFAAALVEQRTPEVSSVLPLLAPGFEDLSVKDSRTYSNKAPGGAALGLPGYVLARAYAGPPSASQMRPAVVCMKLFASTLPVVLLALAIGWAARRLGVDEERIPFTIFTLLFATPLLAYGLLLFSHALVAACLFGAWMAFFVPSNRHSSRLEVLAGALLGLAVVSEYPAAVPAAVLGILGCWGRPVGRSLRVASGGIPFALALFAYNTVCFGGPLALSSGFEKFGGFRELASKGAFGVGLPSFRGIVELLFEPSKGLFVFTPVLILGLISLPRLRARVGLPATLALGGVPLVLLLLYAGYPNRHGGWTAGSRYLVAALPFLVFPLLFRARSRAEDVLLGFSLATIAPLAVTYPFAAPGMTAPWLSVAAPLLGAGHGAPSVFQLAGLPFAAFVPLLLVGAAALLAIRGRRALWAAGGAVAAFLFGALLVRAFPLDLNATVTRAYVREVYFGEAGALERVVPQWESRLPRLSARRRDELSRGPAPASKDPMR